MSTFCFLLEVKSKPQGVSCPHEITYERSNKPDKLDEPSFHTRQCHCHQLPFYISNEIQTIFMHQHFCLTLNASLAGSFLNLFIYSSFRCFDICIASNLCFQIPKYFTFMFYLLSFVDTVNLVSVLVCESEKDPGCVYFWIACLRGATEASSLFFTKCQRSM